MFFVLSGFLITRILLSTKDDEQYFKNFYIRRALRIFPLYYAFLVIFYLSVRYILNQETYNFNQQIYYWVYLQGFALTFGWPNQGPGHYWSLAVEEHFYLFWPILVLYLKRKGIIMACICIITTSLSIRLLLNYYNFDTFYFTYARMDELAFGGILAIAESYNMLQQKYNTRFLLILVAIFVPTIMVWPYFSGSGNSLISMYKFVLLGFIYFVLIGCIITFNDNNILKRFLKIKPLIFTGKISYGLYVFHPICFAIFHKYVNNKYFIIDIVSCFTLSFIIATLSYYLFEAKFLKLKNHFNYRKNKLPFLEWSSKNG